ncbi:hypothetical protein EJB05_40240, partial [Eragrostis curvula]
MEPAVQAHEVGSAVSIEITSIPSSSGEPRVEHAAATEYDVFEEAAQEFQANFEFMMMKAAQDVKVNVDNMEVRIHRYPRSIIALGARFTSPIVVSIGPHHHWPPPEPMEKVKHAAACHCIREAGLPAGTMYAAVTSVAYNARSLYDVEVVEYMARMGGATYLLTTLFFDACFLVQYMRSMTSSAAEMDPSLLDFFHSKDQDIFHDIMLLDNQIPWRVVRAIMRFVPLKLNEFIDSSRRYLHEHKSLEETTFVLDEDCNPPHLLGLLRDCIVGGKGINLPTQPKNGRPFSISELQEIGIALEANKTNELRDMELKKKWPLSAKLFLAPLSLDEQARNMLVNMAALELCMRPSFHDAPPEASAVCSSLQLLAMLVHRVEDAHELRKKRLLTGVGYTDTEALQFLVALHGLRIGSSYVHTLQQIDSYRCKSWMRIKVYAFFYKNGKTIVTVFSIIGAVVGILKALQPLIIKGS